MANDPGDLDLEVELPRALEAPQAARHALRRFYADRVQADVLADAQLLVSELATNAFLHGLGRITLRASLEHDRLRVEVVDEGSGFQREMRHKNRQRVGGWGLGLVEHISSRWGVHEGTTHVWFELELPGPWLSQPHG